jgi:hypothetical protein
MMQIMSAGLLRNLEKDYRTRGDRVSGFGVRVERFGEQCRFGCNARTMRRTLIACNIALLSAGCHSWETRSYEVSVRNAGPEPITVWLTKDGAPFEPGWYSPEDMIIESPKVPKKPLSGVVIAPGKTGDTGKRSGRFAKETHAILRVYEGQLGINELLATHPGPARVDLELKPGASAFIVKSAGHVLDVEPKRP